MKGYFAYIRVSTVKQGEHGSSLQEQRSAIEAYATRHGLSICEWFEERETAAKLGRTQFNSMIGRLGRREAAGVVIHKIDRGARNLRDWARLGDLMDRGMDVHFAHESLDLGSRGGRLAADIQAVVAADYVRNLRDEVRKGFNGRLAQGLYPLPAPLGYRDMGGGKRKEIDPLVGPLIHRAFELYATGRYTVDELRREMASRGLRNRRGSPLGLTSMWQLLRNPFYMGLIHIARTKRTYDGAHEALVSKAVFDRCQAVMSGRSYIRSGKHDFAFSRLIKCWACSRSLIGELQKGHVYYRCHTPACRGTSMREADVQEEFRTLCSYLALDEGELRDLGELQEEAKSADAAQRAGALSKAKLSLGRSDDLLHRLTDAFLDGTIERDLFEARKAKLLLERRGYLEAITQPPKQGSRLTLLKKLELGNVALQKAELRDSEKTRDAVSLILSNLVAAGKELRFALLFPFDLLLQERIGSNGAPYRGEPRIGGTLFARRVDPGAERQSVPFSFLKTLTSLESKCPLRSPVGGFSLVFDETGGVNQGGRNDRQPTPPPARRPTPRSLSQGSRREDPRGGSGRIPGIRSHP
jgi:DNA invertase Pin-like site-specific DNA recombinase